MKTFSFKNNDTIPAFGLGTWKSKPGKVRKAVIAAIKQGYRHIDCAPIYGNEKEVGEGIKTCIEIGLVKREDLWITSKLWNDAHKKIHVKPAIEKTLRDLQLDYLDLYLMHWPIAFEHGTSFPNDESGFVPLEKVPLTETWAGMEETQNENLSRHIGVCNFSQKKLQHLIGNSIQKPEMNQVELHPLLQQQQLVNFCHENEILVTAYSPLGSMDRPDQMKREDEPMPLENGTIKNIADQNGCTPAQILIAWALHRDTLVIPKSTNEDRIKENYEAQDISLSDEDMKAISGIDKGIRILDGSMFQAEKKGYTVAALWDE